MSEGEVPEGWREIALAEAVRSDALIQYGILQPGPDTPGGVPYVRPTEIQSDLIVESALRRTTREIADQYQRSSLQAGDVILSIVGSIGKVAVVPASLTGANITQSSARLRPCTDIVSTGFMAWFLRSPLARRQFDEMELGTGVPRLNIGDIRRFTIPVPPISEQDRIVAKIEELVGSVNAARARLVRVPGILNRFRQSVLSAACSGLLTEDWRETHQIDEAPDSLLTRIQKVRAKRRAARVAAPATIGLSTPTSWPIASMDSLTSAITSGSRAWSKYYRDDGTGTFIMAQNVRPMRFDRAYRLAVAPPKKDPERVRTAAVRGDLLVTIVGANTGDVCRVTDDLSEHYVCQSVAYVRPVLAEMSPFLELWLNSPTHGRAQFDGWIYGEGRPHLSLDHLRETAVALPSLGEQREIVRRVGAFFALAHGIEKGVAGAAAHAEKLTRAILGKAFRGDLAGDASDLTAPTVAEPNGCRPSSILPRGLASKLSNTEPRT